MVLVSDKPKATSLELGLLEDDDEFEEFTCEDWQTFVKDDENINVWEDNWDDDNIEDDFSEQLRSELNKPLPDDKKKKSNADVAAEMKQRESRSQQAQAQVRQEAERKQRLPSKK